MENEKVQEISELIFNSITSYFNKNNHIISVLGLPQSNEKVFEKLIIELCKDNKNILYVLGKEEDKKYVLQNSNINKVDFVSFNEIDKVKKRYYLAIFDDITSFSDISKDRAIELINKVKLVSKRMIAYTVEKIINEGEIIDIAPRQITIPFIEPRVIQTRVNLCDDIPYLLYEYIKWFKKEKKKVIIYVPDEECLNNVYMYYEKKLKIKHVDIVPIPKNEDISLIEDVLINKNEATIIITDYIGASLENTNINSAIVLFADNEYYSARKILFLCGEISRINKDMPEVILVSKTESKSMDLVRTVTRNINKRIWRQNSLNF